MITYLFYLAAFLAVILPGIYLIKRNPDLAFWLFLNLYFDPGGYIDYYLGGRFLSVLTLSDLVILPIIFCLYSVNTSYKIIYKDKLLIKFLNVFIIFVLYFFIVYGAVVPYLHNDLDYILFLQKNRNFLYYIIIFIAAYVFTMRGVKYFYMTTLFIGFIILCAFLITLVTGLDLIPVMVFERYEGDEMMRLSIYSWGLFSIIFPFSFVVFLSSYRIKLNIKYRRLLYAAGILMAVTLLITLSRRYFISIPGTLIIIVLISSYIFRQSRAFALAKILVPLGIILVIINLTLPKYVGYLAGISEDTFQLLTEGSDTRGEKEYRVSGTGDLEITKKYIADNFILGTGYSYLYWGKFGFAQSSRGPVYAAAHDAAGEVPIYYIFFGYGLVGFIIMVFLYSYLVKLFLRLFSLIRKKINLVMEYPYEVLFIIFILYTIAEKFTFSFYGLGKDFNSPINGIFIAMGFALYKKLKNISAEADIILTNRVTPEEYSAIEK